MRGGGGACAALYLISAKWWWGRLRRPGALLDESVAGCGRLRHPQQSWPPILF
jgi:hypothetical protein